MEGGAEKKAGDKEAEEVGGGDVEAVEAKSGAEAAENREGSRGVRETADKAGWGGAGS